MFFNFEVGVGIQVDFGGLVDGYVIEIGFFEVCFDLCGLVDYQVECGNIVWGDCVD